MGPDPPSSKDLNPTGLPGVPPFQDRTEDPPAETSAHTGTSPAQPQHLVDFFLAGAWKGAIWCWGYLESLHNRELRSYPRVSEYILVAFLCF